MPPPETRLHQEWHQGKELVWPVNPALPTYMRRAEKVRSESEAEALKYCCARSQRDHLLLRRNSAAARQKEMRTFSQRAAKT